MISTIAPVLSAVLALASFAGAQTSTLCNPTLNTCPSNKGLPDATFSTDFTKGQPSGWTTAAYTTIKYSNQGAGFTVSTKAEAPTIETDFYFLFGYVEIKMQAAPGTGIVSSIVLESDDLDEIDWEFLGGNDAAVQTNFFGKGNTTLYNRMVQVPVTKTTSTFHTYALNWTSSSLTWLIDGAPVRTLMYSDSLAVGGLNYPQTPCKLKLGNWAGGASDAPGTVEWAGGPTNFANGPFNMYVDSVKIINYNPTSSYTYTDKSGSYTSIKMDNANVVGGNTPSNSNSVTSPGSNSLIPPATNTTTTTPQNGTVTSSTVTSTSTSTSTSTNTGISTSNITASMTLSPSVTKSTSTSVASFSPGANAAAGRQGEVTAAGTKIGYLILAVAGLFLA